MGKDAIGVALKQMVSDPGLSLKFQARRVEVSKSGDLAFTEGSYEMTFTGPGPKPMHDKGSYVTTYRKQADGSWKAVSDIASSELPPGSSAEK
jgi:ketosteroid isomerase-like protein